ncbi:hypothetical protein [Burkholderia plantarii]|uniref:hypothetical protein n=1 Tax=Burkholderia plantarii TaxID=41899 RepID=UPI001495B7F0|nr:hypothetical protein [Burkholderia plantarii]
MEIQETESIRFRKPPYRSGFRAFFRRQAGEAWRRFAGAISAAGGSEEEHP